MNPSRNQAIDRLADRIAFGKFLAYADPVGFVEAIEQRLDGLEKEIERLRAREAYLNTTQVLIGPPTMMHGYDVPVDGTVTTASLHAVLDGYAALREWAIELERRLKKRQSNV